MKTMQRSIVFTKLQMAWLEKRAKELGVTVGEVVRRTIDEVRTDRG